MAPAAPGLPDWREGPAYADLLSAEYPAFAWEWTRRDLRYRETALRSIEHRYAAWDGPANPAAGCWGLHRFEDPGLCAADARPIWRREWYPGVLSGSALPGGTPEDQVDLARFDGLVRVTRGLDGTEHVLVSDGRSSVRLDIEEGTITAGPVLLAYRLSGVAGARDGVGELGRFLYLCRTGRMPQRAPSPRNRRLVLLLRATDALAAEASQRDLAAALLSAEAANARWRSEAPSLRSRAQRLVVGARAMAGGQFRALLRPTTL